MEYRSEIVQLNFANGTITGVDNIATTSPVVSTEYFDLSGRRISKPENGFSIQRRHHADGSVTTVKAMK